MQPDIYLKGNFKGLQHLGIPVTDILVSVDFYSKLGFTSVMSSKVDVAEEHDEILVAMIENHGVIIELYQVTKKQREALMQRSDGHVDHIAFDVADAGKAFDELKAAGLKIIDDKLNFLNFWKNGCKYFTILGPDNEKLEFNQIL
jgi:catechol 2,3-dioxygenase-like lactoylglutathione lyase family enzyme